MFWVYILRSADGSYYTGHADNLIGRIGQFQALERAGYTVTRLPLELVWWQACATQEEALLTERKIKSWSHWKQEAMIRGSLIVEDAKVSRMTQSNSAHSSTRLS